MFDFQDVINPLEILVRLCAFPDGDGFIVRVSSRSGDYFLGIADSYNFAPAASNAIML